MTLRTLDEVRLLNIGARRGQKFHGIIEWQGELKNFDDEIKNSILNNIAVFPVFCDLMDPERELISGLVIDNRQVYVWEIVWLYEAENNGCMEVADPYNVPKIEPKLEICTLEYWSKNK